MPPCRSIPLELPDDVALLKALLVAAEQRIADTERRAVALETRAAVAESKVGSLDAEIANLKLTIAKMRRDTYGASIRLEACLRHEHGAKLLDQLELQLAELVKRVAEDKTTDAIAAPAPATEWSTTSRLAVLCLNACRANGSCMRRRASAPAATAPTSASSERTRPRRWKLGP